MGSNLCPETGYPAEAFEEFLSQCLVSVLNIMTAFFHTVFNLLFSKLFSKHFIIRLCKILAIQGVVKLNRSEQIKEIKAEKFKIRG